jgi:protein disulfide-isomerase-like protein
MIMFYAPWCAHCKRLISVWENLANHFKDGVGIAAVDCTQHSALQERFGIRGYPTLIYFSDHNTMVVHRGERTFDKLVEFIQEG